MTASTPRDQLADFALLHLYDQTRRALGHDFGVGARYGELDRRKRALVSVDCFDGQPIITVAELKAAFERVGRKRLRRAERDAEMYGSTGARQTFAAWKRIEYRVGA
jgi:hypothetical protein